MISLTCHYFKHNHSTPLFCAQYIGTYPWAQKSGYDNECHAQKLNFWRFWWLRRSFKKNNCEGVGVYQTKELNGAVESTDYLLFPTNHDQTLTSLRGFRVWAMSVVAPASEARGRLPARCFWSKARLRNASHCLPKVTHSSAIMRHIQHRGFVPPPEANRSSTPFSARRVSNVSSLTPECSSPREISRGRWGWIWSASMCRTQPASAWIRSESGCWGKCGLEELAGFRPFSQCSGKRSLCFCQSRST